jgi:hypothetical protein
MIDRSRLEDLILARLSVPTRAGMAHSDIVKTLSSLLQRELAERERRDEIAQAVERLRARGFVDDGALKLSEAGRKRLCAAMGIDSVPKARNWGEFKRKHLARLLDKSGMSPGTANPGLVLIARSLGLPDEAARSKATLANACLARSLGVEGRNLTLFGLRTAAVAASLGVPVKPKLDDVLRISARAISGARTAGTADIVEALAARWLAAATLAPMPDAQRSPSANGGGTDSLNRTVEKVLESARSASSRRFGPDKVFIASVWESLRADPEVAALGEAGFKSLLVEAHRHGVLTLARADLVAAMDPADVAASETHHLNATYHFIQVSGE